VLEVPEDPVLEEPVPEVPKDPVLEDPVPEVPEVPELVVAEFCVVVEVLAAVATVVPTPASSPDNSNPAITCFVRSFMVSLPRFLVSSVGDALDLAVTSRGPPVKRVKRR
jgi:hypothetical protein